MSKEMCFSAFSEHPSSVRDTVQHQAIKFWSSRIDKYVKRGNNGNNQGKGDKVQQSPNQIKPHSTVVSHDAARSLALAKEPKVSSISEVAECKTSQMAAKTVPTTDMAIIATGASHSVIGSDHVPAVLRKLPASIRQAISVFVLVTISQVLYSFKQLQIPLLHGRQRIWLSVEVVPRATQFLLSIKAMKSLGANTFQTTHAISRIFNVHSHSRKTTMVCL